MAQVNLRSDPKLYSNTERRMFDLLRSMSKRGKFVPSNEIIRKWYEGASEEPINSQVIVRTTIHNLSRKIDRYEHGRIKIDRTPRAGQRPIEYRVSFHV